MVDWLYNTKCPECGIKKSRFVEKNKKQKDY